MCGIVGLITKNTNGFNKFEQKMFYEMLFADVLRGQDATGVITCHNNGDFGIMKEASDSATFNYQFIDSSLDKDLFKNGSAVIGHNRAKTIGENKDENAHPFVVDNTFAMVHNGTLRNHKQLHDTEVDSEALATLFKQAMDQEDFVQAMSEAVWKVEGAFACVWYDQKRNQVGMIRNSQRPLGVFETKDSLLFASELGLANWIASRNGEKQISHKYLAVDTLYLFDTEKAGGVVKEYPLLPKPVQVWKGRTGSNTGGASTNSAPFSDGKPRDRAVDEVVNGTTPRCSKNAYKRFRNALIGKQLLFTLVDWVEKDISNPSDDIILLGTSEDYAYDLNEVKHLVRGQLSLSSLGMSIKEVDFQTDWIGRIVDTQYDAALGQIIVIVKDILPVVEQDASVH